MSSSGTNSGTPRHTSSIGSDAGEASMQEEQELKAISTQPAIPQNPEPLSLLAESQRLQREMLRIEMVCLKFLQDFLNLRLPPFFTVF